jgi:hypothetical protein
VAVLLPTPLEAAALLHQTAREEAHQLAEPVVLMEVVLPMVQEVPVLLMLPVEQVPPMLLEVLGLPMLLEVWVPPTPLEVVLLHQPALEGVVHLEVSMGVAHPVQTVLRPLQGQVVPVPLQMDQ